MSFQALHFLYAFVFPSHSGFVVGGVVDKEEGERGECREPVVGDWKAGLLGLFLCLLHRHDELGKLGVPGPVSGEFSD